MAETGASVTPLSARNLSIKRDGRRLLDIPSLTIGAPGCTVIVGPNGAGKSLLVRALCDLQACDTGDVFWGANAPGIDERHKVGLLLQRPVLLRRTALANLTFVLARTGVNGKASRLRAMQALEDAGLEQIARVPAHKLSGGEQQRVSLARALLLNPEVLFLDEATANVDPASTHVIEQQLRQIRLNGVVVVMVSHDLGQVRRMADQVLLMHQGRVIEYCSKGQFFDNPSNPLTNRWVDGELLV